MAVFGENISVRAVRMPDGVVTAKAWGHSRPNENMVLIEDVIKVDTPVNELEDFVLEVRCPIIIREMFFTQRDHVAWARTSRVDNLDDWYVHHLWQYEQAVQDAYENMQERRKTASQDHFRLELPLCYMTGFTVKLSARTLLRFIAALHHMAREHVPGLPVSLMLDEMASALLEVVQLTPYGALSPDAYGKLDLLPRYAQRSGDQYIGHFVVIDFDDIPIALRAQVIRHRPIMYFDTLVNYVDYEGMCQPLTSKVSGQIMMTAETALAMVRKRNCWIAQEDLWSPIIQKINALFEKEYETVAVPLPCDKCMACPFGRDNLLRFEKKDPAPPCPIWLGQNGAVPTAEERIDIVRYMGERPLTYHFWQQTYLNFIPDAGA